MKATLLLPVVVLTLTANLSAAPMTDEDREHVLVHFEMTGQMLAEQVRGLCEPNWNSRLPQIAGAFESVFHIWPSRSPTIGAD